METKEIRLINLLTLAKRYGQDVEFCKRIDMNPSYLPQLKARSKSIGDKVARKVEEKLGLERGYMDVVHDVQSLPDAIPAADVMSVAYSIESMPDEVREQFKRLVFQIAAYCSSHPAKNADSKNIESFEVTIPQRQTSDDHQVQKAANKR